MRKGLQRSLEEAWTYLFERIEQGRKLLMPCLPPKAAGPPQEGPAWDNRARS